MKWSLNSAWLATSARYSKTSSRGRAIVISTLTGSTARECTRGRSGGPAPDRQPALGVVHDVRALGDVVAPRPAQLADERAAAVAVYALADQRGAPAVVAGGPIGSLRADALAQELALEIGLGDTEKGPQHATFVRRRPSASCRRPLVACPLTLVFRFGIWVPRPRRQSGPAGGKGPINKPNSAIGPIDTVVIIVTSRRPRPGRLPAEEGAEMESMMSGTLAGTGSFRCEECGYVVNLAAADELPACPGCGGARFTRASLFAGTRFQRKAGDAPTIEEREALVAEARERLESPGQYLAWADGDEVRIVALDREWTRVGRSLAADVRFDDPTVSRRHALIVRQADGVRVLDDRSLNGVFVNGERVEWRVLTDGDEIVVGRYRLHFVESAPEISPSETSSLETAGG